MVDMSVAIAQKCFVASSPASRSLPPNAADMTARNRSVRCAGFSRLPKSSDERSWCGVFFFWGGREVSR